MPRTKQRKSSESTRQSAKVGGLGASKDLQEWGRATRLLPPWMDATAEGIAQAMFRLPADY